MRNRLSAFSLVTGLTLLAFIAGALIVPALLFFVKIPMTPFHIVLVVAVAAGTGWLAVKTINAERPGRLFAEAIIASSVLFAAFFWLSGMFYDLSYDGQAYHQESIIYLNEGWNPVYDEPLEVPTGHSKWVNHYARAGEMAAAVIYTATGLIEHSKVFNLLAIAASFLLSLAALLTLKPGKTWRAVMVAALLALNPVSIYQMFSYYVDGLLASMLLCMVALACLIFARPGWLLLSAFSAAMIFVINIKFTAIAYAGVITIGLLIALYMSEQFDRLKQLFKIAAVGSLAAVLLVGFNPYVTNTVTQGNPLYPLAGEGKVDVVKNFTPRNLETMNRLDQVVHSYFAATTGNSTEKKPTVFKLPFTFSKNELAAYGEPDVAVSGFGPLFGGVLLLSLVVLVLAFRVRAGATMAALGVMVVLAISVLVNPASWWARYVPQLWFIPLLCLWLGFSLKGNRAMTGVSWVLAGVIAVNTLLVGTSYTSTQWKWTQTLRTQLAELQTVSASGPIPAEFTYSWSNQKRFEQWGIAFKEQTPLECSGQQEKMTLMKSGTSVCVQKQ
ncbi:hypothetical protein [Paenibacillus xerothermodurans]|uniref:Glycosyltransferase RgtA/B/C/D-like domain-containing protein n=1 Tax=Paenibacillus xerothermodurans TaxID=1977292 RepID=A0A2W1N7P1_PAEXE|nr:hypothetical protein [Paenibacillus xerothermodurans]PZE19600.1 hypothetical protein CBW46_017960 [Paenibacillus xerothermodurans]